MLYYITFLLCFPFINEIKNKYVLLVALVPGKDVAALTVFPQVLSCYHNYYPGSILHPNRTNKAYRGWRNETLSDFNTERF